MKLNSRFAQRTITVGVAAGVAVILGFSGSAALGQCTFRGVWADAFHVGFKNTSDITGLVSRAATAHYNAIIVEVLAYHDVTGGGHGAYWNSNILPKATDCGGIDPLALLCDQAHAQNIEVHAWLMPYRVSLSWPPSGNNRIPSNGDWLMVPEAQEYLGPATIDGSQYWLDFGNPDVQEYLVSIVRELVTNYPIDGIHWDYEMGGGQVNCGYPANNNAYTQSKSGLARYKAIYGTSSDPPSTGFDWTNFHRRSVNELISRCRAEIPAITSNPRQPLRHTGALMAYGGPPATCNFTTEESYTYYSDWATWLQQGWLDAGIPMNYKARPCDETLYEPWVDRTVSCWRGNRHVYMGVATYMNSFADSVYQIQYACNHGVDGVVTYSYVGTNVTNGDCSNTWGTDWTWYTSYLPTYCWPQPVAPPTMPWRNPATATEGTFWGRVMNASGAPLDDATVTVSGGANKTVKTDANGYYIITLIPALSSGTNYTITASKTGQPSASTSSARLWAAGLSRYDFKLGATAAQIQLSTNTLSRTFVVGTNPPDDTFTLRDSGVAPLNYIVTSNSSLAKVSPVQGSSSGEWDTITISYNTASMPLGTRTLNITITDTMASNSPQTLVLTLTAVPAPVPGDFDGDYDVDMDDFGHLQVCMTGSAGGILAGCEDANLKVDAGIDQADFILFLRCFTAPGVQGDSNCLNK